MLNCLEFIVGAQNVKVFRLPMPDERKGGECLSSFTEETMVRGNLNRIQNNKIFRKTRRQGNENTSNASYEFSSKQPCRKFIEFKLCVCARRDMA